jgi:hypothetical protein
MKNIIIVTLIIVLAVAAGATASGAKEAVWVSANQKVIQWDAVTKDSSGISLPEGAVVTYRVFTKTEPAGVITEVGTVSPTTYTITFTQEGRYWVGVKAERIVNEILVAQSPITWSSDTVLNTDPFGITFYVVPGNPRNIR